MTAGRTSRFFSVKFRFVRKGMEIGLGDEVIPSEAKTLTKTGKASGKKMADGKAD